MSLMRELDVDPDNLGDTTPSRLPQAVRCNKVKRNWGDFQVIESITVEGKKFPIEHLKTRYTKEQLERLLELARDHEVAYGTEPFITDAHKAMKSEFPDILGRGL